MRLWFDWFAVTEDEVEDDEDNGENVPGVLETMMYYQHGRTNSSFAPKF